MNQHLRSIALGTVLLVCSHFSTNALAKTLSPYAKDFQQLFTAIENEYAALPLKEKRFGLSTKALRQKYAAELKQVTSEKAFQRLVQKIIGEFHDSHFSSRLRTQDFYTLGFTTDLIQNQVVISSVDREQLSVRDFPAQVGDVITHWNQVPVQQKLREIQAYLSKSNPQTRQRYSAMLLTQREVMEVPAPDKERAELRIRPRKASEAGDSPPEAFEISLPWKKGLSRDFKHPYCDQELSKFPLPPNRQVVKKDRAYIFPHPTQPDVRVGYLRIPDYLIKPEDFAQTLKAYAALFEVLEKDSDVLILDQTHNCGGNVEMAETLLGFFHQRPYTPVQYRFLRTPNELAYWKKVRGHLQKQRPEVANNLNHLIELLETSLKSSGNSQKLTDARLTDAKLTEQSSLFGQKTLPAYGAYSHPVLLLVNEFSGSAGDVFASYMQFGKLATLMGQTTMGAGGHARPDLRLTHTHITVKMPKMLFYLPDGTALENRGATPDILYTETLQDVMYGYVPYQRAYLKAALDMVNAHE